MARAHAVIVLVSTGTWRRMLTFPMRAVARASAGICTMILDDPETRKQICSSTFRRKGGDGVYTRLFDNLDKSQQEILSAAVELQDQELPIVGSVEGQENWLLLTTARLVWCIKGKREELPIREIGHCRRDLTKHGPRTKLTSKELEVVTAGRKNYLIELEPARPLFATWHVLNNMGAWNRKRAVE
jgi:hypothetical protein